VGPPEPGPGGGYLVLLGGGPGWGVCGWGVGFGGLVGLWVWGGWVGVLINPSGFFFIVHLFATIHAATFLYSSYPCSFESTIFEVTTPCDDYCRFQTSCSIAPATLSFPHSLLWLSNCYRPHTTNRLQRTVFYFSCETHSTNPTGQRTLMYGYSLFEQTLFPATERSTLLPPRAAAPTSSCYPIFLPIRQCGFGPPHRLITSVFFPGVFSYHPVLR